MATKDSRLSDAELRRKAEAIAQTTGADSSKQVEPLSAEEARQTLHELQVHQIELEMQNEELRRTQAELEAARARYLDLYDLAPAGYVTISEQGLLLEANLAAAALLGMPRNTLHSKPFSLFVLAEDQNAYYLHRNNLFETGDPTSVELRMVKQDRTAFWTHLEASYAQESDGSPVCRVILTDITDRKRAEADNETLRAQLVQSQKMDAIGQLAGGVAHDFNNLLTGILGNVAIIRSDLPSSSPLVANLNAVETAAHQAAELAKGLLTFSRRAVVAAVPLDMAAAVDTTLAMLKQSLPATMNIVCDVEPTTWTVLADPSQIAQVILNLAVNARDAMHGEGTLTIRTRNEILGQEYVHNHPLARIGEFVHLSVTDTGPGIPDEIREHLFEPFRTTKPAGSGTGLGLSIVYGAVKVADGWVTANSPEDGGTMFDIFLPRCLEEPSASGVPGPLVADTCSGTVLVVEDEPVVCAVAQSLLKRSGYAVLTAVDGASALRTIQERHDPVDLVLLDMTMPGMTTEEIVRAIRAVDARVPILLTSGYASGDIVTNMLREGIVQGFLPKPYELREMLDNVESLLAR